MNSAIAPVTTFRHHDTFATIPEMDAAAEVAGYSKVADTSSNGFHYERPPGPCPDHGGATIPWTQKKHVSRVGMWTTEYQIYSGY